jgi:hypothetical protein
MTPIFYQAWHATHDHDYLSFFQNDSHHHQHCCHLHKSDIGTKFTEPEKHCMICEFEFRTFNIVHNPEIPVLSTVYFIQQDDRISVKISGYTGNICLLRAPPLVQV